MVNLISLKAFQVQTYPKIGETHHIQNSEANLVAQDTVVKEVEMNSLYKLRLFLLENLKSYDRFLTIEHQIFSFHKLWQILFRYENVYMSLSVAITGSKTRF